MNSPCGRASFASSVADLRNANLSEADLSRANLEVAKVTVEELAQAKSLEGAIPPNAETRAKVAEVLGLDPWAGGRRPLKTQPCPMARCTSETPHPQQVENLV